MESAPPETATDRRSPGRMSVRSKGRFGGGDMLMEVYGEWDGGVAVWRYGDFQRRATANTGVLRCAQDDGVRRGVMESRGGFPGVGISDGL